MNIYESALTPEVLARLIALSEDWAREDSCRGYRANTEEDVRGNRVFLAEEDGAVIGYLFGHMETAKDASSVMPEGTPYFEAEELYVVPERRSRGVGAALFRCAEAAVAPEAEFLLLSTATKNSRAILHFYLDELGMTFWSARLFKRLGGAERQ